MSMHPAFEHESEVSLEHPGALSNLPHDAGNYDVCLSCGGDGGFDDTYIGRDHEVHSDYRECRECEGTGRVFHE